MFKIKLTLVVLTFHAEQNIYKCVSAETNEQKASHCKWNKKRKNVVEILLLPTVLFIFRQGNFMNCVESDSGLSLN